MPKSGGRESFKENSELDFLYKKEHPGICLDGHALGFALSGLGVGLRALTGDLFGGDL